MEYIQLKEPHVLPALGWNLGDAGPYAGPTAQRSLFQIFPLQMNSPGTNASFRSFRKVTMPYRESLYSDPDPSFFSLS